MPEAYLSRIRLRDDVATRALAPLLLPDGQGPRTGAVHRLVWSLFADSANRTRDFLWREDADGHRSTVFTLSSRPPEDAHGLFDLETKPFTPYIAAQQRLSFVLRVNAVTNVKVEGGTARERQRCDVVMAAMKETGAKSGQYAEHRDALAAKASRDWLAAQGGKKGFVLGGDDPLLVVNYSTATIGRRGERPMRFGVLDLAGEIVVKDPDTFLASLTEGFGKARAFGYGLMMVKKAA